jgi:3-mercaptopyruvate sulfurtransferase SseA
MASVKSNGEYKLYTWLLPIVDLHKVKRFSLDNSCLIIDVREAGRYLGENEHMDLYAQALEYDAVWNTLDPVLRLAQTIADLAQAQEIGQMHMAEALQYRSFLA